MQMDTELVGPSSLGSCTPEPLDRQLPLNGLQIVAADPPTDKTPPSLVEVIEIEEFVVWEGSFKL